MGLFTIVSRLFYISGVPFTVLKNSAILKNSGPIERSWNYSIFPIQPCPASFPNTLLVWSQQITLFYWLFDWLADQSRNVENNRGIVFAIFIDFFKISDLKKCEVWKLVVQFIYEIDLFTGRRNSIYLLKFVVIIAQNLEY